jgi:uncharacterized protein (DUF697 family)
MDEDDIPLIWNAVKKTVGKQVKKAVDETVYGEKNGTAKKSEWPSMKDEDLNPVEPDWDALNKKANTVIGTYTAISAVSNLLPMPFDVMVVTGTFTRLATELAGIYQVTITAKRARQMGWAIASSTSTVLGMTYGVAWISSRVIRTFQLIPYIYLIASAVQMPIVAAIVWAAGDTLKSYFRECRQGREPSLAAFSEAFAKTLKLRLPKIQRTIEGAEGVQVVGEGTSKSTIAERAKRGLRLVRGSKTPEKSDETLLKESGVEVPETVKPSANGMSASETVSQIANLHDLLRKGALTEEEFDVAKKDLLKKI